MVKLSRLQIMWLITRGDRDVNDVIMYDGKPSIAMSYGDNVLFSPIPDDEYIKNVEHLEFSPSGHIICPSSDKMSEERKIEISEKAKQKTKKEMKLLREKTAIIKILKTT